MKDIYEAAGKRELFIDDFLIEQKRGLSFRQHSPVEQPSCPNKPVGHYLTVMKDPRKYWIFYRGKDESYKGPEYGNHPGEFVGIAWSDDGLRWELPDLNRFPGKTVPPNTLFFGGNAITHNFVPFYDTNPACRPEERYKAVAGIRETKGLFAFHSPDGLNWRRYSQNPVMAYEPEKYGGHLIDSQNVVFYSETEKCYVMYFRVWKTADGLTGLRSFAKVTSTDFLHWSDPEFLKVNRKDEHLYVSGLAPYSRAPQYYVGAATRYFGNRGSATDITLIFSRGGKGIIRPDAGAWITPGLDPERWTNRMNYIAWGIVQKSPEELVLYHGRKKLMYTLRTDGFVSLSAGLNAGTFLSRVLSRGGCGLELNLATSAGGSFRMEVCDAKGRAVPGFRFADMEEFYGDSIAFVPRWNGKTLADLPSDVFRIRVKMKECDLYSISFPSPAKS